MRPIATFIAAGVTLGALALATPASAQPYYGPNGMGPPRGYHHMPRAYGPRWHGGPRRGWNGGAAAAGIIGGLALGALAAGALAAPGPVYAAPPPPYEPACGWRRERVWDGYGWSWQSVRVCD